jgi:hypothetical protein
MHLVKQTIHVIEVVEEAEARRRRYREDRHQGTWS